MIAIVGLEKVTILETQTRRTIVISEDGGYVDGRPVQAMAPVYTDVVPQDHFARETAERLAAQWAEIQSRI